MPSSTHSNIRPPIAPPPISQRKMKRNATQKRYTLAHDTRHLADLPWNEQQTDIEDYAQQQRQEQMNRLGKEADEKRKQLEQEHMEMEIRDRVVDARPPYNHVLHTTATDLSVMLGVRKQRALPSSFDSDSSVDVSAVSPRDNTSASTFSFAKQRNVAEYLPDSMRHGASNVVLGYSRLATNPSSSSLLSSSCVGVNQQPHDDVPSASNHSKPKNNYRSQFQPSQSVMTYESRTTLHHHRHSQEEYHRSQQHLQPSSHSEMGPASATTTTGNKDNKKKVQHSTNQRVMLPGEELAAKMFSVKAKMELMEKYPLQDGGVTKPPQLNQRRLSSHGKGGNHVAAHHSTGGGGGGDVNVELYKQLEELHRGGPSQQQVVYPSSFLPAIRGVTNSEAAALVATSGPDATSAIVPLPPPPPHQPQSFVEVEHRLTLESRDGQRVTLSRKSSSRGTGAPPPPAGGAGHDFMKQQMSPAELQEVQASFMGCSSHDLPPLPPSSSSGGGGGGVKTSHDEGDGSTSTSVRFVRKTHHDDQRGMIGMSTPPVVNDTFPVAHMTNENYGFAVGFESKREGEDEEEQEENITSVSTALTAIFQQKLRQQQQHFVKLLEVERKTSETLRVEVGDLKIQKKAMMLRAETNNHLVRKQQQKQLKGESSADEVEQLVQKQLRQEEELEDLRNEKKQQQQDLQRVIAKLKLDLFKAREDLKTKHGLLVDAESYARQLHDRLQTESAARMAVISEMQRAAMEFDALRERTTRERTTHAEEVSSLKDQQKSAAKYFNRHAADLNKQLERLKRGRSAHEDHPHEDDATSGDDVSTGVQLSSPNTSNDGSSMRMTTFNRMDKGMNTMITTELMDRALHLIASSSDHNSNIMLKKKLMMMETHGSKEQGVVTTATTTTPAVGASDKMEYRKEDPSASSSSIGVQVGRGTEEECDESGDNITSFGVEKDEWQRQGVETPSSSSTPPSPPSVPPVEKKRRVVGTKYPASFVHLGNDDATAAPPASTDVSSNRNEKNPSRKLMVRTPTTTTTTTTTTTSSTRSNNNDGANPTAPSPPRSSPGFTTTPRKLPQQLLLGSTTTTTPAAVVTATSSVTGTVTSPPPIGTVAFLAIGGIDARCTTLGDAVMRVLLSTAPTTSTTTTTSSSPLQSTLATMPYYDGEICILAFADPTKALEFGLENLETYPVINSSGNSSRSNFTVSSSSASSTPLLPPAFALVVDSNVESSFVFANSIPSYPPQVLAYARSLLNVCGRGEVVVPAGVYKRYVAPQHEYLAVKRVEATLHTRYDSTGGDDASNNSMMKIELMEMPPVQTPTYFSLHKIGAKVIPNNTAVMNIIQYRQAQDRRRAAASSPVGPGSRRLPLEAGPVQSFLYSWIASRRREEKHHASKKGKDSGGKEKHCKSPSRQQQQQASLSPSTMALTPSADVVVAPSLNMEPSPLPSLDVATSPSGDLQSSPSLSPSLSALHVPRHHSPLNIQNNSEIASTSPGVFERILVVNCFPQNEGDDTQDTHEQGDGIKMMCSRFVQVEKDTSDKAHGPCDEIKHGNRPTQTPVTHYKNTAVSTNEAPATIDAEDRWEEEERELLAALGVGKKKKKNQLHNRSSHGDNNVNDDSNEEDDDDDTGEEMDSKDVVLSSFKQRAIAIEEMKCMGCRLVCYDLLVCVPCGHVFCGKCMETKVKHSTKRNVHLEKTKIENGEKRAGGSGILEAAIAHAQQEQQVVSGYGNNITSEVVVNRGGTDPTGNTVERDRNIAAAADNDDDVVIVEHQYNCLRCKHISLDPPVKIPALSRAIAELRFKGFFVSS